MKKIKCINCFGTSYTAGGGFEFDGLDKEKSRKLHEIYSNIDSDKTSYHFSWPGQLQNIIGNDIKVNNYAKSGYGNSRLFRLTYDLINSENFNTDEHVFIFEFAGMGRDEFFVKELQDYIICNYVNRYNINKENNFRFVGAANSYVYDNNKTINIIEKYNDFFETYVSNFLDFYELSDKIMRECDFFISYLEKQNINFIFVVIPIMNRKYGDDKSVNFGDSVYFKSNNNFVKFIDENNLRISDETMGRYNDNHSGFKGAKIVSECVYNKLVEDGLINNNFINIDWEWYSKNNFI
jgi:hypothetical protein